MMRSLRSTATLTSILFALAAYEAGFYAQAAPIFVTEISGYEGLTDDLFDMSQGNQVIFSTPQSTTDGLSDPRAAFGGESDFVEPSRSFFEDGSPAGTIDFIEWQTSSWINLTSFDLRLHQNWIADQNTGAASFSLFASRDGMNFSKISEGVIPPAAPGSLDGLLLIRDENLTGTTTNVRAFRLEVTRLTTAGVRIIELDAIGTLGTQTVPYLDRLALNAITNSLIGRPSSVTYDDEGPGLVIGGSASTGIRDDFFADVGGNNDGVIEPENYIFADGRTADNGDLIFGNGGEFVDFISGQSAIPQEFAGFRLNIAADVGSLDRGVELVRFFVDDREVDFFDNNGFSGEVLRVFAGGPVVGENIRIEFTRTTTQGSRIVEIDALLAPEPSAVAMLAAGIGLLSCIRRRG
jgi:hypothetical protein